MKHYLKVAGFFSVVLLAMALISCSNPSSGSSSGSQSYTNNFKGTTWVGFSGVYKIEFTDETHLNYYVQNNKADHINRYEVTGDRKCKIYETSGLPWNVFEIDSTDPTKAKLLDLSPTVTFEKQ